MTKRSRWDTRRQQWIELPDPNLPTPHRGFYWFLAFVVGGLMWGAVLGAIFRYLPGIVARLMR